MSYYSPKHSEDIKRESMSSPEIPWDNEELYQRRASPPTPSHDGTSTIEDAAFGTEYAAAVLAVARQELSADVDALLRDEDHPETNKANQDYPGDWTSAGKHSVGSTSAPQRRRRNAVTEQMVTEQLGLRDGTFRRLGHQGWTEAFLPGSIISPYGSRRSSTHLAPSQKAANHPSPKPWQDDQSPSAGGFVRLSDFERIP